MENALCRRIEGVLIVIATRNFVFYKWHKYFLLIIITKNAAIRCISWLDFCPVRSFNQIPIGVMCN